MDRSPGFSRHQLARRRRRWYQYHALRLPRLELGPPWRVGPFSFDYAAWAFVRAVIQPSTSACF
jgi:hypothetical protein